MKLMNTTFKAHSKYKSSQFVSNTKIITLSSLKFSVCQIENLKVGKTAVHNAIMKYQIKGTFKDRKRSGSPRVTSSSKDRLMSEMVALSPMGSYKNIQDKLKKLAQ